MPPIKAEELTYYDVAIVGAGVAGSAMAAYLGQSGIKVAVVEKDFSEPNKIIGELLQPGGVKKLSELGLDQALLDIDACEAYGYAVFLGSEDFTINYPGANRGRSFKYGRFIQNLRAQMARFSSVSLFEGTVKGFWEENETVKGIQYTTRSGEEKTIRAHLTIICDGGMSRLKNKLNHGKVEIAGFFMGLELKNCTLPHQGYGHVFLNAGSPILSYQLTSNITRMLIDFPGKAPLPRGEALTQFLRENIQPHLPESMHSAFEEAVQAGDFKFMPNRKLPADPSRVKGAVLVGDSLNMRHPVTGGGMTVALTDVHSLGSRLKAISDLSNTAEVEPALKDFYQTRHLENATLNILADALYHVFRHEDLRTACFDYLQQGGKKSAEPISILSGVSRDQNLLMKHFFSVAGAGAFKLLKPFPNMGRSKRAFSMLKDAVNIISPLLHVEKPGPTTAFALKMGDFIFKPDIKENP